MIDPQGLINYLCASLGLLIAALACIVCAQGRHIDRLRVRVMMLENDTIDLHAPRWDGTHWHDMEPGA